MFWLVFWSPWYNRNGRLGVKHKLVTCFFLVLNPMLCCTTFYLLCFKQKVVALKFSSKYSHYIFTPPRPLPPHTHSTIQHLATYHINTPSSNKALSNSNTTEIITIYDIKQGDGVNDLYEWLMRLHAWFRINSGDGWKSTVEMVGELTVGMVGNRQWRWLGIDSGDGNPSRTHQRGAAKVPISVSFSVLLE